MGWDWTSFTLKAIYCALCTTAGRAASCALGKQSRTRKVHRRSTGLIKATESLQNKEVYHMGWDCSAGKETTGTADERGMWSQEWPGEHDKNVSLSEQELGSLYIRLSVRFKAKHTQHKTALWLLLPQDVVEAKSRNGFKNQLENSWKESPSKACRLQRWRYSPSSGSP